MAKTANRTPGASNIVIADGEELHLGNRHLAAFLAWVVPGAGHFYQRRYFKSMIFSISVFSTFLIGMFVAGGNCVYASWNTTEKRWQFALQAGIGMVAIPAIIQNYGSRDGQQPPFGSLFRGPKSSVDIDNWHKSTASGFDMGTLYTMIAGLLNVLVAFDAYAGPLPPPVPKKPGDSDNEAENDGGADETKTT